MVIARSSSLRGASPTLSRGPSPHQPWPSTRSFRRCPHTRHCPRRAAGQVASGTECGRAEGPARGQAEQAARGARREPPYSHAAKSHLGGALGDGHRGLVAHGVVAHMDPLCRGRKGGMTGSAASRQAVAQPSARTRQPCPRCAALLLTGGAPLLALDHRAAGGRASGGRTQGLCAAVGGRARRKARTGRLLQRHRGKTARARTRRCAASPSPARRWSSWSGTGLQRERERAGGARAGGEEEDRQGERRRRPATPGSHRPPHIQTPARTGVALARLGRQALERALAEPVFARLVRRGGQVWEDRLTALLDVVAAQRVSGGTAGGEGKVGPAVSTSTRERASSC